MAVPKRRSSKPADKTVGKKVTKKSDSWEDDAESVKDAKPESERADVFKLENKKQKARIGFPLIKSNGDVGMVKVTYFKTKFGQTLADGKWHAFQAPLENDELMEACKAHPKLDMKTDRATIVIKYDTDAKGIVHGKGKAIGYELLAMKINNPKLIDLQEIDEDEGLTEIDVSVRLDAGKDPKFQDLRFKAEKGKALWLTMDADTITDEVGELAVKLKEVIAFKYPEEKIEALIGESDESDEDDEYEDADDEDEDEDDFDEDDIDDKPSKSSKSAPAKTAPKRRRA